MIGCYLQPQRIIKAPSCSCTVDPVLNARSLPDDQDFFCLKFTRRKHRDHMADSFKRSSVNWMVVGWRLLRSIHGFFLLSAPFQTYDIFK